MLGLTSWFGGCCCGGGLGLGHPSCCAAVGLFMYSECLMRSVWICDWIVCFVHFFGLSSLLVR